MTASGHGAPPTIVDWGRTRYRDALARQQELVANRVEGSGNDMVVLTEHEPVFTVGLRAGAERNLIWSEHHLRKAEVEVVSTNRGGDITYHGPGQLVAYPIVSLDRRRDLHAYLRFLEDVLIHTVAEFGVTARRRDGKTGIWVADRKIAAIGVAVRRWIAYHGIALNVQPNLAHFEGIIPCGIPSVEGTVTSLAAELPAPPSFDTVKAAFATQFLLHWEPFITANIGLSD
ncbi:MAG: lipoyl(octanoyl) transferase LipB [Opitutaceae bacterium]|nr:lipoyl(octanoyl) transferase LipB [Opitutaceae bacterium]